MRELVDLYRRLFDGKAYAEERRVKLLEQRARARRRRVRRAVSYYWAIKLNAAIKEKRKRARVLNQNSRSAPA